MVQAVAARGYGKEDFATIYAKKGLEKASK